MRKPCLIVLLCILACIAGYVLSACGSSFAPQASSSKPHFLTDPEMEYVLKLLFLRNDEPLPPAPPP